MKHPSWSWGSTPTSASDKRPAKPDHRLRTALERECRRNVLNELPSQSAYLSLNYGASELFVIANETTSPSASTFDVNKTSLLDPASFAAPILDAIRKKADENSDALSLIGFMLFVLVAIGPLYRLYDWLRAKLSQYNSRRYHVEKGRRRVYESSLLPRNQTELSSELAKRYTIDKPPKWWSSFHTQEHWRSYLESSVLVWVVEVVQPLTQKEPYEPFHGDTAHPHEAEVHKMWQRILTEEPDLKVHQCLLANHHWFERLGAAIGFTAVMERRKRRREEQKARKREEERRKQLGRHQSNSAKEKTEHHGETESPLAAWTQSEEAKSDCGRNIPDRLRSARDDIRAASGNGKDLYEAR